MCEEEEREKKKKIKKKKKKKKKKRPPGYKFGEPRLFTRKLAHSPLATSHRPFPPLPSSPPVYDRYF